MGLAGKCVIRSMHHSLKIALLCITLLVFGTQAAAQSRDCHAYRNGVFRIDDPESGTSTTITRKGGKQREVSGQDDILLKVKWIDDCTYTLTLEKVNGVAPSNNKGGRYDPRMVVTVEIYETHGSYYMQRSSVAGMGVVFTSKVSRIK